jgi:hypothetical protein
VPITEYAPVKPIKEPHNNELIVKDEAKFIMKNDGTI